MVYIVVCLEETCGFNRYKDTYVYAFQTYNLALTWISKQKEPDNYRVEIWEVRSHV